MADDVNLYSYVGNSPVMKVDSLGLFGTVDGDIESFLNGVYAGGGSISMNAMSQGLDQIVQEASSRIPCPVKQIVNGAIYGDYISNANGWNVVGQIAVGFTVAGIAGDIRDIKYQRDNGTGFDVMISSIGILPLVGDAVKLGSKSVRKADYFVGVALKSDDQLKRESIEEAQKIMENAKLNNPGGENAFCLLGNVANKSNYTNNFWKSYGKKLSGYNVHHSIPQKYEIMFKNMGINIHENKYLRGVEIKYHKEINKEWIKFDPNNGRINRSFKEILKFKDYIDNKYSNQFIYVK